MKCPSWTQGKRRKRSNDRTENGKCTNVTNRASQPHFTLNNRQITKITLFGCFPSEIFFSSIAVENSWKIKLLPKPVGITAKTSLPSSKQFTAILCPCFCSKCKLELTESLRNAPWVTKSTDARRVTWNALRLHWILSPVIFNQSDRCVRQQTRGIQNSIARVQAHFSSPHSSRRLRRLAIAAPPPLPIKWACLQANRDGEFLNYGRWMIGMSVYVKRFVVRFSVWFVPTIW